MTQHAPPVPKAFFVAQTKEFRMENRGFEARGNELSCLASLLHPDDDLLKLIEESGVEDSADAMDRLLASLVKWGSLPEDGVIIQAYEYCWSGSGRFQQLRRDLVAAVLGRIGESIVRRFEAEAAIGHADPEKAANTFYSFIYDGGWFTHSLN